MSLCKVGAVMAQGDRSAGLARFRKGLLSTRRRPRPREHPVAGDLSSGLMLLASIHEKSGDLPEALRIAERGLGISERLSQLDPTNAQWSQDVVASRGQVTRLRKQTTSWRRRLLPRVRKKEE
jgi:uncharacterized membrane protein YccC